MLRNSIPSPMFVVSVSILNEVLSLNAQESSKAPCPRTRQSLLNEVLSLNAQEFHPDKSQPDYPTLLNEVLSLNAQESSPGNNARKSDNPQ